MKIIISPAKKLNTERKKLNQSMSFYFLKEASELINILKEKDSSQIRELMNLSDNLAQLNWQRFQDWEISNKNTTEALFIFQGDVYKAMAVDAFSKEEISFAQGNLRIISGLYGLLKPLDRILPYRLEMGTKLVNSFGNNLYDFWEKKLKLALLSDMQNDEYLINLASSEYCKALRLSDFSNPIMTPIFKDYKNGNLKVISFFAKKARGLMCNFIIKNKITNVHDLKLFKEGGYKFSEENNNEYIFTR